MLGIGSMVELHLKYIVQDRDRHGNVRVYFKRAGQRKVRLRGEIGSEEFMRAYRAALENRGEPALPRAALVDAREAPANSFRWLVAQYVGSAEFIRLDPATQRSHRRNLEILCARQGKVSGQPLGMKPAAAIEERHIFKWRDELAATPGASRHRMQALRALFKWAKIRKLVARDPAKEVPILTWSSEGFHSWSLAEVEQFETCYPIGTMARLALALFLYTGGQRISDVAQFGRQHLRGDYLFFTQQKGRTGNPVTLHIPVIAPLRHIIDATPRPANAQAMNFLLTEHGKPFSLKGLGNRMRKWCDKAGLPHCSAHGLRKAFGARAAEWGLTSKEIQSLMGHRTLSESERYTRAAEQKLLADAGMAKVEAALARAGGAK